MIRYDFYKSLYDRELAFKEELGGALNTPFTMTVILGGIMSVYYKDLTIEWSLIFAGSLGINLAANVAFAGSIYYMICSWIITGYMQIENSDSWRTWDFAGARPPEEEADSTFREEIIKRLSEAATFNRKLNVDKSAHLYKARRWLVATLLATSLGGIPYLLRTYKQPPVITLARVVDTIRVSLPLMSDSDPKPSNDSGENKRPPSPSNVIIREDKSGDKIIQKPVAPDARPKSTPDR